MFHITVTLVATIIFSDYFGGLSIILKRLSVLLGMVTGLSVLLSMVTGLEKTFDGKTKYEDKSLDPHQTLWK